MKRINKFGVWTGVCAMLSAGGALTQDSDVAYTEIQGDLRTCPQNLGQQPIISNALEEALSRAFDAKATVLLFMGPSDPSILYTSAELPGCINQNKNPTSFTFYIIDYNS